jgi:hypothetical protein
MLMAGSDATVLAVWETMTRNGSLGMGMMFTGSYATTRPTPRLRGPRLRPPPTARSGLLPPDSSRGEGARTAMMTSPL